MTAAITGAVIGDVSALAEIPRSRIEVYADGPQSWALKIKVVQRSVRVVADPGARQRPATNRSAATV